MQDHMMEVALDFELCILVYNLTLELWDLSYLCTVLWLLLVPELEGQVKKNNFWSNWIMESLRRGS